MDAIDAMDTETISTLDNINEKDCCNLAVCEEEENWDDWQEEEFEDTVKCLFCEEYFPILQATIDHCSLKHEFDFSNYIKVLDLDIFASIRLVNFIREVVARSESCCVAVQLVKKLLSEAGSSAFEDDRFMKPFLPCDQFICLLGDDEDDMEEGNEDKKKENISLEEVEELRNNMKRYAAILHNLTEDDNEIKKEEIHEKQDNNTYYFDSYSQISIHREMISDKVRTDSYRDAIFKNKDLFQGKVVLDIGCGTGILSMFAAQAGASQVIGIDCSSMLDKARDIVIANKLEERIILIKGMVEEVELPVSGVDIIISEWMGYGLLYESMLDTVIFARNKWLKPNGIVLPDKASLHVQAIQDLDHRLDFWDNVYGFDMSAIKKALPLNQAIVQVVKPQASLSSRCQFKEIFVNTTTLEELNFTSPFKLDITKEGTCHGVLVSFDIFFSQGCKNPVFFSTGIESTPTHWQQVFFHWTQPMHVKINEKISGNISFCRNKVNPREIDIVLQWTIQGQEFVQQYIID